MLARWAERLDATRRNLGRGLALLIGAHRPLDATLVDEVETLLLSADVGLDATRVLLQQAQEQLRRGHAQDSAEFYAALRRGMLDLLAPCAQPLVITRGAQPFVLMVVGVNGAGKTTTIGKLAHRFKSQGLSVMLAAGDTFRAAAVEQLQAWGQRNDVPVIAQATARDGGSTGSAGATSSATARDGGSTRNAGAISSTSGADAAAVTHDAMQAAIARKIDVLIVDTAGRLHTQSGLMDELKKIRRIIGRFHGDAPQEVLLVLDAGTGQNALAQLQHFHAAVGVTGLCLTKLDGTAKGGILFAMAQKAALPIRYIGLGEGLDDLQTFDSQAFVDAVLPTAVP